MSSSCGAASCRAGRGPSRRSRRGRVLVRRRPVATTAARQVDDDEAIKSSPPSGDTYVSRGGHKLAAGARRVRRRRRAAAARSTSARRPAGSPTACCSGARRTSSRSTSAAASSRGRCARTRVSRSWNARTCATLEAGRDRSAAPTSASPTSRSSRCARSRRISSRSPPRCRLRAAGEAAVRGGAGAVGRGGIVRDPAVHDGRAARGRRRARRSAASACARSSRRRCAAPTATSSSSPTRARAGDGRRRPDRRRGAARTEPQHERASPLRAVGLVPHRDRGDRARARAVDRGAGSASGDVEVRVPKELAAARRASSVRRAPDAFAAGLDLVMSLGGDGTMLHAVAARVPGAGSDPRRQRRAARLPHRDRAEELDASLPRLVAGDFAVSERMVLAVEVDVEWQRERHRGSR